MNLIICVFRSEQTEQIVLVALIGLMQCRSHSTFFNRYKLAGSSRRNYCELQDSSIPTAIISHSKLVKYMQANVPAIPYCCIMEIFYITGSTAPSLLHKA